jgi:hypothetical protein
MAAVSFVTVAILLAVLWSGIRRLGMKFGSRAGAALSVMELLGVALAVFVLGWGGLGAFVGANVIAVMICTVVLASRQQAKLAYASTLCGVPRKAMYRLAARLRRKEELRNYTQIAIADLIVLLANHHRTLKQIESMAVPIAMLKAIHEERLDWLVDRFDRIVRLSGVADPREVAGIVHNVTVNSPMSFRQALDAFVTVDGDDTATLADAA